MMVAMVCGVEARSPLIHQIRDVRETIALIRDAAVPDPRDRAPGCPEPLAALLGRALAADPGARPATATELRRDLEHLHSRLAR